VPSNPAEQPTQVSTGIVTNSGRLYLMVVGDERMVTVPLPLDGEVVLGRDPDCSVPLPHPKISRRHARIFLGRELTIEDLGSTNGIKVGGLRLERGVPAPLPIGESVRLGPYTAIVLPSGAGSLVSGDHRARASLVVRDPTASGHDELLERVAKNPISVLIQGETGTGKDVLARTIHRLSTRPGELVAINCAALTGPLLESELFGHERGAFTGATRTKPGLLEVAGKGTALLDEIGDLSLDLQGKLLRALESRQIYRVGGVQPIDLQVRILSATHRDLPAAVARGDFREDLFFRLDGITLTIPPLRERRGAIAALAEQFLDEAAKRGAVRRPPLTPPAIAVLTAHAWPGNVRELRLVMERALLVSGGGPITPRHILLTPAREGTAPPEPEDEKARFVELCKRLGGNASAIARELSTSRSQVRRIAERLGVDLQSLRS
jgi:two-component system response regulator AtoC